MALCFLSSLWKGASKRAGEVNRLPTCLERAGSCFGFLFPNPCPQKEGKGGGFSCWGGGVGGRQRNEKWKMREGWEESAFFLLLGRLVLDKAFDEENAMFGFSNTWISTVLLASETCKEVQKKQSSSPKRFSLHHVGSFACRVIFSDVTKKNVEVVSFKSCSQPTSDLDKRNEGLFYSSYLSLCRWKEKSIQLYLGLIRKLLINSLLPPQTREGRKTLTLESMTSPHRRGTDVRLAALDSFLVFVGCGFLFPPPAQGSSLGKP